MESCEVRTIDQSTVEKELKLNGFLKDCVQFLSASYEALHQNE